MGEYAFLQANSSTTDTATYTFAGENLGTAAADRYIIVCIQARNGSTLTLSTVTVGGQSASIVANSGNTTSGTNRAAIAIAAVPTGTTGDVVVAFTGTGLRCAIQLYRATGLASATPTDTDTSTAADPTATINTANGFAVGCAISGGAESATWTNLTEDSDTQPESLITATSASAATTAGTLAITCNFPTGVNSAGAFASWEFASDSVPHPNLSGNLQTLSGNLQ